mgnify:CR=1 FL=1
MIQKIVLFLAFFFFPLICFAQDVILNEIKWKGSPEWIELKNLTSKEIDLSGWRIENAKRKNQAFIFPEGSKIPPYGYFLISDKNPGFQVDIEEDLSLNDDYSKNGPLVLKNKKGEIVDQTPQPQGKSWPAGDEFFSMQRENEKWISKEPSPQFSGKKIFAKTNFDKVYALPQTPILFDASLSEGKIEKYFWNFGDGKTAEGKRITHLYQKPGKYLVYLKVSNEKEFDEKLIEVIVFTDKVSVNEIFPNPKGEDSNEWIEIKNFSNEIQDISFFKLSDGKNEFVFPEGSFLLPNQILLLPKSLTKLSLKNEKGEVYFFYPSGDLFEKVSWEKAKEGYSFSKIGENFVETLPSPGKENIFSQNILSFLFQKIFKIEKEKVQKQKKEPKEIFPEEEKSSSKRLSLFSQISKIENQRKKVLTLSFISLLALAIFSFFLFLKTKNKLK